MSHRGWRAFWGRGGWWKAVPAAVVNLALYQLIGFLAGLTPGAAQSTDEVLQARTTCCWT